MERVELDVPYGRGEAKAIVRAAVIAEWQRRWDSEVRGRHLYAIQASVTRTTAGGMGRRKEVVWTRMRLGHNGLNSSLFRVGRHETGGCPFCGELETVEHILLHCTCYEGEREIMWGRVRCHVPEDANITDAWRNVSIPTEMVNGKLQYSKCRRYSLNEISKLSVLNSSPVDINLTHIPQEDCVDGWTYDRSTFYSTIITEVSQ
ncbi:hypothetical protein SKAU_G00227880 [Synaphobranchus kaupii]|uniref:Reverse transcriptase zinc-binding domain-containing protein n=1 Tax=Synaphobranchus kaupii TaxID=118154 RepID=A0A9Q1ISP5_SYNKA|nr:hypothetical protein SKAU_G00227880 [Synaphobranchus kaupii]